MSGPAPQTALAIAAAVRAGETSAVAVVEAALRRIGADRHNCFTAVTAERALAEARAVDRTRAAGLVLRHLRTEADLWAAVARRVLSVRPQPGPCRTVRHECRRPGGQL